MFSYNVKQYVVQSNTSMYNGQIKLHRKENQQNNNYERVSLTAERLNEKENYVIFLLTITTQEVSLTAIQF